MAFSGIFSLRFSVLEISKDPAPSYQTRTPRLQQFTAGVAQDAFSINGASKWVRQIESATRVDLSWP
jgi:hypothetical protein